MRLRLFSHVTNTGAVAALYDRAAKGWQAGIDRLGYATSYRALAGRAVDHYPVSSTEHILDVGTGSGALAIAFAEQATDRVRFDLLDVSPKLLAEAAKAVPNVELSIEGPIGSRDVTSDYDRILCGHAVEHCDDVKAALTWIFQRLRPGGSLILAVSRPHWCTALVRWRWGNSAHHPSEVAAMLTATGFDGIKVCPHESGPPSRISCGYLAKRPDHIAGA